MPVVLLQTAPLKSSHVRDFSQLCLQQWLRVR